MDIVWNLFAVLGIFVFVIWVGSCSVFLIAYNLYQRKVTKQEPVNSQDMIGEAI